MLLLVTAEIIPDVGTSVERSETIWHDDESAQDDPIPGV
jgi:hypothetical protein